MDITQVILEQHDQQRQMFAQIEQFPTDDTEGLAAMWKRLAILLEDHAEAEELFFYPVLLKVGKGEADADDGTVDGEVEDAIGDHNQIRDAVRKANAAKTGTKDWWQAVTDANIANSKHMGEEERQDLFDFRRHASLQQRDEVAHKFLRFMAMKAATGTKPIDKDPDAYVEDPEQALKQAKDPNAKLISE